MTTILSNLNRRFPGKFEVKWILKISSHLANVATLRCETLMSAKRATDDKLQGSVAVATYWRCGGVVNNQIRKGLLLTLSVDFLNRSIFGKVTSKNVIVSCTFFVSWQCVGKACKVHETTTLLLVTLPNFHRLYFFSLTDLAINFSKFGY